MRRTELTRDGLLALRAQQLARLNAIRSAHAERGDTARVASLSAILAENSQSDEQKGDRQ